MWKQDRKGGLETLRLLGSWVTSEEGLCPDLA